MSKVADKINDAIDRIVEASNDEDRKKLAAFAKGMVESEVDDLEEAAGDNEEQEQLLESQSEEIKTAVHRLLDEVDRPVGTQSFTVPKTPAVDRALLGLHDAIGRSL